MFCEQIDVGEETGHREIASGLRVHYELEEMQDKKVLVVCNLKVSKIVGFASNGMVLAAKVSTHMHCNMKIKLSATGVCLVGFMSNNCVVRCCCLFYVGCGWEQGGACRGSGRCQDWRACVFGRLDRV